MNLAERMAAEMLIESGFEVYRSGWPDFLVVDPALETSFGLEFKDGGDIVRPAQEVMHAQLELSGLRVVVATPRTIGDIAERNVVPGGSLDLERRAIQYRSAVDRLKDKIEGLRSQENWLHGELIRLDCKLRALREELEGCEERARRYAVPIPSGRRVDAQDKVST